MKRGHKHCDWCMNEVKNTEKVCEKCLPEWQECEDQLAPIRAKAALAKPVIEKSTQRKKKLEEQVRDAEAALRHAIHALDDHEDEIASELALQLGIECVDLGDWECEHSPTGHCFYAETDHCNDSCLMCGQPDERK